MTPETLAKITEWNQIKEWLATAKVKESELRTSIADDLFQREANGAFKEGTQNLEVDDLKFKLVSKMNRKILEEMEDVTLKQLGEVGAMLIKRKPELVVSIYKKLTDEQRAIADGMLLVTPGSIELEIVAKPEVK